MKKKILLTGLLLLFGLCFADQIQDDIVKNMPNLVMQLGLIIFCARLGSMVFERIKIPGVMGELVVGMLIGPYLLGSVPIIGYPYGIFGGSDLSHQVPPELYGIAVAASIILLFLSGLETDTDMFVKFSIKGTIIGISGIVFSFFIAVQTAMFFLKLPFNDPKCLFLGVMSTATSVAIASKILSDRGKTDSPEGNAIITGAVIDDIIGVILLAGVMGIAFLVKSGGQSALSWSGIGKLALKEVFILLAESMMGLFIAHRVSRLFKKFKNNVVFSVLAFCLSLIVAGIFDRAGLAMILGAYVVGFTLSKSDIRFTIQEALHPLKVFFVPVFFTVMGMLVNVYSLFTPKMLIFGLIYTVGAIISKYVGCAVPALFLGFNKTGAHRIGLGMVPRGELALIVVGIGLSYGFLSDDNYNLLNIAIMMTLVSTLVSPYLLNRSLKNGKTGVKKEDTNNNRSNLELDFIDSDICEIVCHKILVSFRNLSFFISKPNPEKFIFQIRKKHIFFILEKQKNKIIINSDQDNIVMAKRIINESFSILKDNLANIYIIEEQMNNTQSSCSRKLSIIQDIINIDHIAILKSKNKNEAIRELVALLKNETENIHELANQVISRENSLNSGLYKGLAIPHIHCTNIEKTYLAIGVSKAGVDFNSIDNSLSHLIILIISPSNDADCHIYLLSEIIKLVKYKNLVLELKDIESKERIYELIKVKLDT
jgi:Kef-type K+ transport system membrane component KefB/mannitol/fructose-specific phosphotransferase system IIA component (Ntr-type)